MDAMVAAQMDGEGDEFSQAFREHQEHLGEVAEAKEKADKAKAVEEERKKANINKLHTQLEESWPV